MTAYGLKHAADKMVATQPMGIHIVLVSKGSVPDTSYRSRRRAF